MAGINYTDRRIYVNTKINGRGPFRIEYDTGADISILTRATATKAALMNAATPLHICGVGGSCQPVSTFNCKMEIENTGAFNTTVAVQDSPSDLICTRDVTKRYRVDINPTSARLIPLSMPAGAVARVITPIPTIGRPVPQVHPKVLGLAGNLSDVDVDAAALSWNIKGELDIPELLALGLGGYLIYNYLKK